MPLHRIAPVLVFLLATLAPPGCAGEAWEQLVGNLLRWDPQPKSWQSLVPNDDPGDTVPVDARARWLAEHRVRLGRNEPDAPDPGAEERDDLGVPTPAAVRHHPDLMIPVALRFIGGTARQRHDRAVTCLIQFQLKDSRADALRPLLPWLADPSWSAAQDRLRLIQSLERVIIPEAEAGLLHVLEHEQGWERRAAADALAAMHCPAAGAYLRKITTDGTDLEDHVRALLWARAACGGFTDQEALSALEASARAGEDVSPYAPAHFTARVVSETPTIATDALARLALTRAEALLPTEPTIARHLRDTVTAWPVPTALDAFLDDLAGGRAGTHPLIQHLQNSTSLRRERTERLRTIANGSGSSAAIAIVLLGNHALRDQALTSTNAALVATVCAASRMTGEQPPAAIAAAMDHPAILVKRAAMMWATETTDPAVRTAILARLPGQMPILGRLPGWDPGHTTQHEFARMEDSLRAWFRQAEPPRRLHALVSAGYFGDAGQRIIEERDDHVRLYLYPDDDRYRCRDLSGEEWARFRATLTRLPVERLPAAEPMIHDGIQYEHLQLDAAGGFRVWMNNPQYLQASPWDQLVQAWSDLSDHITPAVHWPALDTIVGARVLYDGGVDGLACVAVDGSDGVRIRLAHFHHRDDVTGTGWFRLTAGGRTTCDPPSTWPVEREPPSRLSLEHRRPWQTLVSGSEVATGSNYGEDERKTGLWWLRADGPVLLKKGLYRFPLAIPGTTQVVVKTAGQFWLDHPMMQVIDCATGAATDCAKIPAGDWKPLAWVAQRDRMLLEDMEPDGRAASNDPAIAAEGEVALALGDGQRPAAVPRLLWLDPRTGTCEPASGDPEPLRNQYQRPLQSVAGRADLVWAATTVRNATLVGHYQPGTLTFTPLARIERLDFSSQQCWIDEAGDRLLLTMHGDLLMIPLAGIRLTPAKP